MSHPYFAMGDGPYGLACLAAQAGQASTSLMISIPDPPLSEGASSRFLAPRRGDSLRRVSYFFSRNSTTTLLRVVLGGVTQLQK